MLAMLSSKPVQFLF